MTDAPERIFAWPNDKYWRLGNWSNASQFNDAEYVSRAFHDAAIAAEREACAKVAEDFHWSLPMFESSEINEATDDAACAVSEQIAAAICARKDTE